MSYILVALAFLATVVFGISYTRQHTVLPAHIQFTLPSISPTLETTILPTNITNLKPGNITTKQSELNSFIDCTGLDGKHLNLTQKQCDDFNNAWKPTPTSADSYYLQQYIQNSLQSTHYSNIKYCNQAAYEASVVCVNTCSMKYNLESGNCNDPSTINDCLLNARANTNNCDSICQNQFHKGMTACGN